MKTQNPRTQKGMALSFLAALVVLSVGCAKKSDGGGGSSDPVPTTPSTTGNTGTGGSDTDAARGSGFAAGATTALTVDSAAALTSYVGTHPVNSPKDTRISVKLLDDGSNRYSGDVYISYYDNGQYYTGHFTAQDVQNPSSGTNYPNWKQTAYNNWFSYSGGTRFHGFFQDSYGAVMLVVDSALNQNDGAGAAEVSGSIWFKNYPNSQAMPNNNNIPCWFISMGPYDCRTLLVPGDGEYGIINQTSALYPTQSKFYTTKSTNPYIPEEPARGWRRLGTFSGLNRAKAFTQ